MSGELYIYVRLFPGTDPGTLWLGDWGRGRWVWLKSQSERRAVVKIQVCFLDGS